MRSKLTVTRHGDKCAAFASRRTPTLNPIAGASVSEYVSLSATVLTITRLARGDPIVRLGSSSRGRCVMDEDEVVVLGGDMAAKACFMQCPVTRLSVLKVRESPTARGTVFF